MSELETKTDSDAIQRFRK